jgi:hypothetical protein
MKTNKDLAELFEQARRATPEAPVSKLLSLVEQGKTSPLAAKHSLRPRRIMQFFNPLKILIMITPIVIITSVLLIFNPGNRKESNVPEISVSKFEQEGPVLIQKNNEAPNLENKANTAAPKQKIFSQSPLTTGFSKPNIAIKEQDTVLQGVILELTNEELTSLGFHFSPNGFTFLNRMNGGRYLSFVSLKDKYTTHIYLDVNEEVHYMLHQDTTSKDYYPEAISNQQGKLMYDLVNNRLRSQKGYIEGESDALWEHINDTLVPVRINSELTRGYDATPIILWFKASESFFSVIGSDKTIECQKIWRAAKEMSINGGNVNHVVNTYQPYKEPENLLVLSSEFFKCLGFYFENGDYSFYSYINKTWFRFDPHVGDNSFMRNQVPTNPDFSGISTPVLSMLKKLNGDYRVNNIDMIYDVWREHFVEGIPFMDALELCIPIKIADTTLHQHVQDCIFWIYPNDRFLGCLPKEIGEPMRKERNYQLKKLNPNFVSKMNSSIGIGETETNKESVNEVVQPVPCVYFTNLCESLPGVDYVNLYPNPATDKLNVDLILQKAKRIRFRVIDLGGREITEFGIPENYTEGGQFKHQLDISNLQSGLYVLVMTDEEGAKLSRRFIKN